DLVPPAQPTARANTSPTSIRFRMRRLPCNSCNGTGANWRVGAMAGCGGQEAARKPHQGPSAHRAGRVEFRSFISLQPDPLQLQVHQKLGSVSPPSIVESAMKIFVSMVLLSGRTEPSPNRN